MIRYDIIRYYTGERIRRIVDVPLTFDEAKGLSRIDTNAIWKWRDSPVPLSEWINSGLELSEDERLELTQKLRFFVGKQTGHFESLE